MINIIKILDSAIKYVKQHVLGHILAPFWALSGCEWMFIALKRQPSQWVLKSLRRLGQISILLLIFKPFDQIFPRWFFAVHQDAHTIDFCRQFDDEQNGAKQDGNGNDFLVNRYSERDSDHHHQW